MADQPAKMVLRTVYLPPELDEKLRVSAFRKKVTKNDLIRDAIARELAGEPAFGEDVAKIAVRKVGRKGSPVSRTTRSAPSKSRAKAPRPAHA